VAALDTQERHADSSGTEVPLFFAAAGKTVPPEQKARARIIASKFLNDLCVICLFCLSLLLIYAIQGKYSASTVGSSEGELM
jgi:hypothetical protein